MRCIHVVHLHVYIPRTLFPYETIVILQYTISTRSDYHFTCLNELGVIQCDEGYTLTCLVSATYGNSAGACSDIGYNEVRDTPLGCGWDPTEAPVVCADFECTGSHESQVEGCEAVSKADAWIATDSPCLDCMPLCHCGDDSPQFYNVADCFGDPTSSICMGNTQQIADSNLYLPQSVWDDYCEGRNSCVLNQSLATHRCYNSEDEMTYEYFESIVVNQGEAIV
eukprot:37723_1